MIGLSEVALLKSLVGAGGSGGSGNGDAALEAHRNAATLDHPDGSVTMAKLAADTLAAINAKLDAIITAPSVYPPYEKPSMPSGEMPFEMFLAELMRIIAWIQDRFDFYGVVMNAMYAQTAQNAQYADTAYNASYAYDAYNASYAYDAGRAYEAEHAGSAASLDSSGYDWYCLDKMRQYMAENFGLSF